MRMIKRWMKNNKRKLSCACLHYWRCQKSSCSCNSPQVADNSVSYDLYRFGDTIVVSKGEDTISISFTENEGEYSAVIVYNSGDDINIENADELYEALSTELNAENVWNILYALV